MGDALRWGLAGEDWALLAALAFFFDCATPDALAFALAALGLGGILGIVAASRSKKIGPKRL